MSDPGAAVTVLGVDVGTTHSKAALCDLDGTRLAFASGPTPARQDAAGHPSIDPGALWDRVARLIQEVAHGARPAIVGVAGMAEAGLLVDRLSGIPRSQIIPWYDPRSAPQAGRLEEIEPAEAGFRRSGLHPSFKYGLAKILWLREQDAAVTCGSVWLSVPDYIVYRLTGCMATDPTLAARTYAYGVKEGAWDEGWIGRLGLHPSLFPTVLCSGVPAGRAMGDGAKRSGLPAGTPVAVSGHDHLCALIGVGITDPGPVLDSVGTAESLMGVMHGWEEDAYSSGLTVAPCVLPGRYCWLGGSPASGGSIEWLRAQLGETPISYGEVERLASAAGPAPTGITYFPYLSGSGAPWHNQEVRAAFVGLGAGHSRGDLVRAVMEGTAYQALSIQAAAEALTGTATSEIVTVGGGTRSGQWLKIKADVTGKRHLVPDDPEAAVRGAAFTAAVGSELLDAASIPRPETRRSVEPDAERHRLYMTLYERDFMQLQGSLRSLGAPAGQAAGLAHA